MKKLLTVLAIFSVAVLSGLGCKKPQVSYEVPLDVWGVFDNTNAYSDVFDAYQEVNANVSGIRYQKHTIQAYKKDLINALAAGTGPDIFMIHNSWLPDFEDKIVPMPEYFSNEQAIRNTFADVVTEDMMVDGRLYGLPLSVDSLALYYNKDIFNAAGITRPPTTWEEFENVVQKLTVIDEFGVINQSAAAMGTADNINRSMDLLTVLMLQYGTEMTNSSGVVSFDEPVSGSRNSGVPAAKALSYYLEYASASSPLYTWNTNQNYSIDEFFEGETAMMINYSWHYDTIKAKNAKLNFAVADLPQTSLDTIGNQANFANYWVMVVAKNKTSTQSGGVSIPQEMRVHEAWQLLKSLTFPSAEGVPITNYISGEQLVYPVSEDLTKMYLERTRKPAARRDLIDEQVTDVRLSPFAKGNLIAKTWRRSEATAVDAIFIDMIKRVNRGELQISEALELAARRAQQLQ